MRRAAVVAALAALALTGLLAVPSAQAQTAGSAAATTTAPTATVEPALTDPNAVVSPPTLLHPPPGHRLSGRSAERIADGVPKIVALRRDHPKATREAFLKGTDRWQVSYYDHGGKEIGQVLIDDATGEVLEAWTGLPGRLDDGPRLPRRVRAEGHALWVWLPLLVLFVAPFVQLAPAVEPAPPRPRRAGRAVDLAGLLLPRGHRAVGPAGLSRAALRARAHAVDRAPRAARPRRPAAPQRARALARRRRPVPGRLPDRPERRRTPT